MTAGSIAGMLTPTDRASAAIVAADEAARRFNPDARVRVRLVDGRVIADLADGPGPGEHLDTLAGVEVILADDLEGTLDAGDHAALFLT
jgi:hypothetical protein